MLQPKLQSVITRQFTTQIQEHPAERLTKTLLSILKRCKSSRTVKQIHAQMLVHSIEKPNFLIPKLVEVKDMPYAYLIFSQIPNPNDYAFNIMIRGITTAWNKYGLALEFYYEMKSLGLRPNKFTYPFVLIACAHLVDLSHGTAAHGSVFRLGLNTDDHVAHSLITMYARCGELLHARKVFDEIDERDLVSWNSMISGYAKMGWARDAVQLFREMRGAGFVPNEMTIVSTLSACGDLGDLSTGRLIVVFILENEIKVNSFVGSALIDMYGKCGDLASATKIFDGMEKKDAVTWNAMITGYAQNGMADEAIALFNSMKEAGVDPNKITLTLVLSSCASVGALDLGKWVDNYVLSCGIKDDIYIGTALIDMYAKCGCLNDALNVFEEMPKKNDVSWNAMISALASHGRAKEALALFRRMLKEGGSVFPNDITFVGVLSACVHAGLVDQGRYLFKLMGEFGLEPKIEHFSCMVDLLSRAGLLYEAWDFITKMPGKPDEVVLGALLGACQKCRNAEIGERVTQLLLEMEPSNSANYVISSKLYADIKRWDESARMRMLMRDKGVAKVPGCSWIEIESLLHEFHAGDPLPDSVVEIYVVLVDEMRREGYVPNVQYFIQAERINGGF
ncbi:hypothetical protein CDL15_Pgr016003 [Punica granatum]|uniref:Pentatricopeptide repeat-containing protein At2g34400 n=1 Tax=Punica granatum TaxID=22663 RepID=A0A218XPQ7_PUNGR|nr:hypothetical protein CDL15_Pgr016003 [Punica granatum]